MSKDETQTIKIALQPPGGTTDTLLVNPRLLQRSVARNYDPGQEPMRQWFQMKYYDDLSDIRREVHGYYKHLVHNFVTSFFTKDRVAGKKILDFGCGPGFYSAILAQRGAGVTGIDKSQFLIDKANEHKARLGLVDLEFVQADLITYSVRWDAGAYDYVIAIDTIVSFDHGRATHNHERVAAAFRSVCRLLKEDGRFFIIESHPFFGRSSYEIASDSGDYYYVRPSAYKIQCKPKSYPHHWFTLDEMTRATSESGLAVLRIYEPDPSTALKQENAKAYFFRVKYPGMIVYEICKIG